MDKKFDYSEFELGELTYHFSNLTSEQADEKRTLYEQFLREKEDAKAAQIAAKAAAQPASEQVAKPAGTPARPAFRPTAKPALKTPPAEPANSAGSSIEHPLTDASPDEMQQIAQGGLEAQKHPVFKPTYKPETPVTEGSVKANQPENDLFAEPPTEQKSAANPSGFRPGMKPAVANAPTSEPVEPISDEAGPESQMPAPTAKPAGFRPTMKPPVKEPVPESTSQPTAAKPAFKPTMKPAATVSVSKPEQPQTDTAPPAEPSTPKMPAFRPTMKPARSVEDSAVESAEDTPLEVPKPKPAFRPTMKPAPTAPASDALLSGTEELVASTGAAPDSAVPTAVEAHKPKPTFRPSMKPKPKSEGESE